MEEEIDAKDLVQREKAEEDLYKDIDPRLLELVGLIPESLVPLLSPYLSDGRGKERHTGASRRGTETTKEERQRSADPRY